MEHRDVKDKMRWVVAESKEAKIIQGPNFHHHFNKINGEAYTWGAKEEDDPQWCPVGPLIADIELSTVCHQKCSWCYKCNSPEGKNMSFGEYVHTLKLMPKTLTQVALGIGDIDGNEDLWHMMHWTRMQGYIPNITINGYRMTPDHYGKLASLCGAVSVSNYDKDVCYRAVEELNRWKQKIANPTLQQINIHQLLCEETYNQCMELMRDVKTDSRLKDLNAIVFLLLKPKGNRNHFHCLKDGQKYKELIDFALDNHIPIGFDSCGANSFLKTVKNRPNYKQLEMCAESCESTCFSLYIDVDSLIWPCSFCAEEPDMKPIHMQNVNNFLTEVWHSPNFKDFRKKLLDSQEKSGRRMCPMFDIEIGQYTEKTIQTWKDKR